MSVLFSLPLQRDSEPACVLPAAAKRTEIILQFINFNSAFHIVRRREKCRWKSTAAGSLHLRRVTGEYGRSLCSALTSALPPEEDLVISCLVVCDLKNQQTAITSSAPTVSV